MVPQEKKMKIARLSTRGVCVEFLDSPNSIKTKDLDPDEWFSQNSEPQGPMMN